MGRYYSGSIEGKMWVAVQDSTDASHFGVEPTDQYTFYGCDCCATDSITFDEEKDASIFCDNCYDSLADHLEQTQEDREAEVTYWCGNEIVYSFTEEEIPQVKKVIAMLEKKVGSFMTHYKIMEENGSILYEYTLPETNPNSIQIPFIARLCLGKQILYCLEKKGTCSFVVELG